MMKAIDLYSGVGGWTLGMKMAGIEVVASYEWWGPANRTNAANNGHTTFEVDIRSLRLADLPSDIDIVVGSPPCTEFSYANRGGGGDIEDGLKDIYKFLEIVEFVQPKFWAMENVPRVASILRDELMPGGSLERFGHLQPRIHVVDMDEFGLPQRRSRCIAGSFDFDLLFGYRSLCTQRTLGQIVNALNSELPFDPIYSDRWLPLGLNDHDLEAPLDLEESRMNKEAKTFHPVYNNMPFPDPLDRPSRTITALCTRISRESVVIDDLRQPGTYRRLSIRERASAQGFPIDFQFYGSSHAQKMKLVGNAVPPLLTFYIGQAMQGVPSERLEEPSAAMSVFVGPSESPPQTTPDTGKKKFPSTRRFRAAIPGLRFKSGMRFDLSNAFDRDKVEWKVGFYFGNSKNIQRFDTLPQLGNAVLLAPELSIVRHDIADQLAMLDTWLAEIDPMLLQSTWCGATNGLHPFEVVDVLGEAMSWVDRHLSVLGPLDGLLFRVLGRLFPEGALPGYAKLQANANAVLAGILIGGIANGALSRVRLKKAA